MRLLKLTLSDVRFQLRYGFYLLYAIFAALYVFLLLLLPGTWRLKAGAILIYSDPAALGLFFMGAILLLEKSQRVLAALAVSPVKVGEYILAKVFSLCLISVAVSLLLAQVAGIPHLGLVAAGTALSSVAFSLLGIVVGAKVGSLNQYVLATLPLEVALFLPPLLYLFWNVGQFRWYPLCGAAALLAGASRWPLLDLGYLLLLDLLLFAAAHGTVRDMWRRVGGVKL